MIQIPYGKRDLTLNMRENMHLVKGPAENIKRSHDPIRKALRDPIGTKRLEEICEGKKNCVIVVDDHTRNTPTKKMVGALLETLGGKMDEIKVIFATGTHRSPRRDEIRSILGKKIMEVVKIESHDCDDEGNLVYLGRTSFKTPVYINRTYLSSEIKIITGDISLHYYAGFGGGRKSILPGLAGRETIKKNHSLLLDSKAFMGNLDGNPVHLDMMEAARMPGAYPDFSLNVISDSKGDVLAASSGDLSLVFEELVKIAKKSLVKKMDNYFDEIVVGAGGHPRDINLYQSAKALEMVKAGVRPNGKIILLAECIEGIGDETFEAWMEECKCLDETEDKIKGDFELGGHKAYYLRKIMNRNKVFLISSLDDDLVERWGMIPKGSLDDLLDEIEGKNVGIIPTADFMIERR